MFMKNRGFRAGKLLVLIFLCFSVLLPLFTLFFHIDGEDISKVIHSPQFFDNDDTGYDLFCFTSLCFGLVHESYQSSVSFHIYRFIYVTDAHTFHLSWHGLGVIIWR